MLFPLRLIFSILGNGVDDNSRNTLWLKTIVTCSEMLNVNNKSPVTQNVMNDLNFMLMCLQPCPYNGSLWKIKKQTSHSLECTFVEMIGRVMEKRECTCFWKYMCELSNTRQKFTLLTKIKQDRLGRWVQFSGDKNDGSWILSLNYVQTLCVQYFSEIRLLKPTKTNERRRQ